MKNLIALFSFMLTLTTTNYGIGVEGKVEPYKAPEYEYTKIDESILSNPEKMQKVIDERQSQINAWEEKSKELSKKEEDTSKIDEIIGEGKKDIQGLQVTQSEYKDSENKQQLIETANKIINGFDGRTEEAKEELQIKIDEANKKITESIKFAKKPGETEEPPQEPSAEPTTEKPFIKQWFETTFQKLKKAIKNFFTFSRDPIVSDNEAGKEIFADFAAKENRLNEVTDRYISYKNFYITNGLAGDATQFNIDEFKQWIDENARGGSAAIENYEIAKKEYDASYANYIDELARISGKTREDAVKIYENSRNATPTPILKESAVEVSKGLNDEKALGVQGEIKAAEEDEFKSIIESNELIPPFENPYTTLDLPNFSKEVEVNNAFEQKIKNIDREPKEIYSLTQRLADDESYSFEQYKKDLEALGPEIFEITDARNLLTDYYVQKVPIERTYQLESKQFGIGKKYVDGILNNIIEKQNEKREAYPEQFEALVENVQQGIKAGIEATRSIMGKAVVVPPEN